jgi:alcohol dehydrogenase class IV
MAFQDPSTGSNPKKITQEDLNEMYKKSISGELF